MTVAMQDAAPGRNDEAMTIWLEVGAFFTRHHTRIERRLDRLETDVAGLKTAVSSLEARVDRMDRSMVRGFARVDAQFERLVALIQRAETTGS